ncbi:maestro heat-like repeat-containing protein family member 2B [Gallus gallus]|uniref:maestro heat-like repeat-containing protein family member 2B n=1 Tax=Gallus gallus TaxID=9031 RepID=UPI001AE48ECF|nr:maestro heat-like repeat-containing protein family member 2B [Gallus gallus]XP_046791871.1 maestro heat-like repeat-containing protein family member 2B [Gallus gallus]
MAPVRRAISHFIKDVLSANAQSCSAWDVVGHILQQLETFLPRKPGKKELSKSCAWTSWVTGCLCERDEQNTPDSGKFTESSSSPSGGRNADMLNRLVPYSSCGHGCCCPLLTPQTLLARLLVVAGSPFAGSELQAAALRLMQNLHSKIHRAVGAMWAAEIPLLLQCLEGKDESFPDSAEWEQRLLKFLRASLDTLEDEAWTKGLSCELSRWLSSSPSSSGEKSFLYKALGTVLGACKEVLHIQEKLLQHLEGANAEEPSEAQGMISLLSHAAESNFHTALDTLTMFASRLCKGQNGRISRRKKMELDSRRAQATRSALILAHGSLALRASKEQLLARLEGDIVGNILLLYSCSCRDLQNTLALLQSITDFSSAFQAVGDSACFNPSLKGKLLEILTELLKKYYLGTPVSPVPLKVVLALEQLSKLKPSLATKDMCDI